MDDADGPVAKIGDVFTLDDTFVGVISTFGMCVFVSSVSSFWADFGPDGWAPL